MCVVFMVLALVVSILLVAKAIRLDKGYHKLNLQKQAVVDAAMALYIHRHTAHPMSLEASRQAAEKKHNLECVLDKACATLRKAQNEESPED